MRTIAHLSDLHFGRDDPAVVAALLADLETLRPSVVAVSGDLTQRARVSEFGAARAFLDRIPAPLVVVPGNHDVPLYDVVRRFASPLGRYRRLVTAELAPVYADDELVVAGVSTARAFTWKEGRLSLDQIAALRQELCGRGPGERLRVLVAHHPLGAPADRPLARVAGRSDRALRALTACGLDVILTGHLHRPSHGELDDATAQLARSVLVLHAGSATSVRLRGEPNSYNWIEIAGGRLELAIRSYARGRFAATLRRSFARAPDGWRSADAQARSPAPLA
jgi:3',5'-cyclic AMP phosphodiesterase CpdA